MTFFDFDPQRDPQAERAHFLQMLEAHCYPLDEKLRNGRQLHKDYSNMGMDFVEKPAAILFLFYVDRDVSHRLYGLVEPIIKAFAGYDQEGINKLLDPDQTSRAELERILFRELPNLENLFGNMNVAAHRLSEADPERLKRQDREAVFTYTSNMLAFSAAKALLHPLHTVERLSNDGLSAALEIKKNLLGIIKYSQILYRTDKGLCQKARRLVCDIVCHMAAALTADADEKTPEEADEDAASAITCFLRSRSCTLLLTDLQAVCSYPKRKDICKLFDCLLTDPSDYFNTSLGLSTFLGLEQAQQKDVLRFVQDSPPPSKETLLCMINDCSLIPVFRQIQNPNRKEKMEAASYFITVNPTAATILTGLAAQKNRAVLNILLAPEHKDDFEDLLDSDEQSKFSGLLNDCRDGGVVKKILGACSESHNFAHALVHYSFLLDYRNNDKVISLARVVHLLDPEEILREIEPENVERKIARARKTNRNKKGSKATPKAAHFSETLTGDSAEAYEIMSRYSTGRLFQKFYLSPDTRVKSSNVDGDKLSALSRAEQFILDNSSKAAFSLLFNCPAMRNQFFHLVAHNQDMTEGLRALLDTDYDNPFAELAQFFDMIAPKEQEKTSITAASTERDAEFLVPSLAFSQIRVLLHQRKARESGILTELENEIDFDIRVFNSDHRGQLAASTTHFNPHQVLLCCTELLGHSKYWKAKRSIPKKLREHFVPAAKIKHVPSIARALIANQPEGL